ncbi:MAG: efflux RND transporter periplasmic adaptor subunit [Verrucomicrobia bacterium]|jgi:cobalt-zinc-cadmium efflux system membrane fusion protein|nr:efflux RND transporter periplasmic adaptor subunit [Verrucomicrobiota bacterium]
MKNPIPHSRPRFLRGFPGALLCLALFSLIGCGQAGDEQTENTDGQSQGDSAIMAGFIGLHHEHQNPDETCFICDPAKRDQNRLWCKEHGRYEDRCWACHPELEEADRLFCREHALYEDECHLCHPELKGDAAATTDAKDGAETAAACEPGDGCGTTAKASEQGGNESPEGGLFCNEHGVYERECGICQPDLAASLKPGESLKVRFISELSAEKAGIVIGSPRAAEVTPSVSVYCQTEYNLNALARITPLVDGIVQRVHKDLGDTVKTGEPLIEIHSSAVADAKSAYLSALVRLDTAEQTFKRQEKLDAEKISAKKDLIEARGAFRSASFEADTARQRLINFGMSEEDVVNVKKNQDTSAGLTLRAPFDGTLVTRHAVVGETVKIGHELYTLADLSEFWLELSIPPNQLDRIAIGQPVEAHFSELRDRSIKGRIIWIDTSVDSKTRMVRARAVVRSSDRQLSVGLYGEAFIAIAERRGGVVVPASAVQRHEGDDFVFVRDSTDLYALRRVELSARRDGQVEVIRGLKPGEPVVTKGSFIAMSEFLKSRLGAGCVH